MNSRCPVCETRLNDPFLHLEQMPVHIGLKCETMSEACYCPKGDIALSQCPKCHYIGNVQFDHQLLHYGEPYDNSLGHSPLFVQFAENLIDQLIQRYALKNETVIDIGCGTGDFLKMMCERGAIRGIGIDPSIDKCIDQGNPVLIKDYYQTIHASQYQPRFITCRHVLEHIELPIPFLQTIQESIDENTVVYFEVPSADYIFEDFSIWDIIYEHCSYFSSDCISYLFHQCGFELLSLRKTYENQYLSLEAMVEKKIATSFQEKTNTPDVSKFADQVKKKIDAWKQLITEYENKKIAIWGAGAKTVTFLNLLKEDRIINHVVDLNPNKHGHFIPGTGQPITAPVWLLETPPDAVIVMNPIYIEEVQKKLKVLDINPKVYTSHDL